jgi:hypothetical protein
MSVTTSPHNICYALPTTSLHFVLHKTEWQNGTVQHPVFLIHTFKNHFKKHKLQKNKMTISICSTHLPLAVSPLLLFRFRNMMTRPSPSLLLHGAPFVPIEIERWNVRPLLPSLSLSLKGPSDIGWTDNKSDKTHYTNNLQYNNFIILQREKNHKF